MVSKIVLALVIGGLVLATVVAICHWFTGPLCRPGSLRCGALASK
jgi:hypothetical protein